jgi:uncharacterized membrane protein YcfT
MVLVVLLHTDHALAHIAESNVMLHLLNELLVPLRQPLFFLISGMLGAGILGRGMQGVLVHRVGRYFYLYILWWLLGRGIHTRLLDRFGPAGMEDFFMTPESFGELLIVAHDDHWFFYALGAFFLLALVLSRLPDRLHAALALLIAVPGLLEVGPPWGVPALDWLWYYPFFAFGTRRAGLLWRLAPRLAQWPVLIAVAAAWAVATRYAIKVDPLLGNGITAALALVAVPVGLGASVRLAMIGGPLARGLILVGRNTLPIYVLHPLVLRLFFIAIDRPLPVPKAAWVILLAAAAVILSLLLGRMLARIPGLFSLPPLPHFLAARRCPAPVAGDST